MRHLVLKLVMAFAVSLALTACVPGEALIEAGLAQPPAPKLVEGVYASSKDSNFNLPAVPVEKVPPQFLRQTVRYVSDQPVGTVIINPAARLLYLITGNNQATRYGIAVGRAGFEWSGEAIVSERKLWPNWTPPPEMIERKPELAKWEKGQPGGLENPLGARALYLTSNGIDYGYRIHGTPEWQSIGTNASSGCIRMINQDVIDLYSRVPDGAKVIVLNADGSVPVGLKLPPKAPAPKKAVAKKPTTAAAPAAIVVQRPNVMPAPIITGTTPIVAATPATAAGITCTKPLVAGLCPSP